jgi:hypothetical protein
LPAILSVRHSLSSTHASPSLRSPFMRRAIQSTVSRRPPLLPTRPLPRNTTTTTTSTTTTTVDTNGWRSYASSVSGNGGNGGDREKNKKNKRSNDERWKKPPGISWDGFRKTNKHFRPRGKSQKKGQKRQEEEEEVVV